MPTLLPSSLSTNRSPSFQPSSIIKGSLLALNEEGRARDDWLSESSTALRHPLPRPPWINSWNEK